MLYKFLSHTVQEPGKLSPLSSDINIVGGSWQSTVYLPVLVGRCLETVVHLFCANIMGAEGVHLLSFEPKLAILMAADCKAIGLLLDAPPFGQKRITYNGNAHN